MEGFKGSTYLTLSLFCPKNVIYSHHGWYMYKVINANVRQIICSTNMYIFGTFPIDNAFMKVVFAP